jgi:lysophospholipase L1-like esterase
VLCARLRNKRPLPYLLALVFAMLLLGGETQAQTPRILLIGDSWVAQAWSAGAFQTALANQGLAQFGVEGGSTTIGGTTAAQWATQPYLDLITAKVNAYPSLDIFHLSMGGNDFLGAPAGADLLALANQIIADQVTVVNHILSLQPNAKITIGTYDYTPSGENNIGQAVLTSLLINAVSSIPNYYVLNQLGLLHSRLGFSGLFPAGATPEPGNWPYYQPLQGGDPLVGGDPAAYADAIHPTSASYVVLAEHAIDAYYEAWLTGAPLVPTLQPLATLALMGSIGAFGFLKSRRRLNSSTSAVVRPNQDRTF